MSEAGPVQEKSGMNIVAAVAVILGVGGLCCVGGLGGSAYFAVQSYDESRHRAGDMNNLRQISLALLTYEADHRTFPPAVVRDASGRPMHSWRVLLLPHLGRSELYEAYDFDEPWDGPNNKRLHSQVVDVYRNPANVEAGQGRSTDSDYAAIVSPHGLFRPDSRPIKAAQISDGLSRTIAVVETRNSGIHWMEPRDLDGESMSWTINGPSPSIASPFPSGAPVALTDGSVHFLNVNTPPERIKAAVSIDGGEVDPLTP